MDGTNDVGNSGTSGESGKHTGLGEEVGGSFCFVLELYFEDMGRSKASLSREI